VPFSDTAGNPVSVVFGLEARAIGRISTARVVSAFIQLFTLAPELHGWSFSPGRHRVCLECDAAVPEGRRVLLRATALHKQHSLPSWLCAPSAKLDPLGWDLWVP